MWYMYGHVQYIACVIYVCMYGCMCDMYMSLSMVYGFVYEYLRLVWYLPVSVLCLSVCGMKVCGDLFTNVFLKLCIEGEHASCISQQIKCIFKNVRS